MASKAVIDTLIAEAGGEGDEGLIAAAWAIQQRAAARGQTTDQVVRSGFDGFSKPGSAAVRSQQDPAMRARVERIMSGVESGSIPNPVAGADHFVSGSSTPSWAKDMKLVATIGGHRFYASGNVPDSAQGGSVGTKLSVTEAPTPRAVPASVTARRNQVTPVTRSASVSKTNAADGLALNPVRGSTPEMDASYDREQGVMRLQPSAIGEMPTLDATRAAFGLAPKSAVGGPPTTRTVKSVSMPPVTPRAPSASDMARGKTAAPAAVTRTAALAGSVQMAPGARPSVIPSTVEKPAAKADPAYGAAGNPFKPGAKSDPAYNAPGNPFGRAPLVITPPNQPAGTILGKAADRLVSPGYGALTTKAVEVENPAYASMLRQIEAGSLIDSGGLSRDALALKKAGAAQATAMLKAKLATIPKTVTVQRQVRAPVVQRAPVAPARAAAPTLTKVQQLQAQGLSKAAAYARLNTRGSDDAADRVNGSSTRGSGGARSLMD